MAKNPRTNPKDYMRFYQNSSEAKELLETPEVYTERKRRVKTKRIKKIKIKTKYKYELDKRNKLPAITYLVIFVFFAGCIGTLMFSAQMSEKTLYIDNMRSELANLEKESAYLSAEISSYDLAEVEEIASNRLGMSKPGEYQKIYIDVREETTVIQYDAEKPEVKKGYIDLFEIFGFFKNYKE